MTIGDKYSKIKNGGTMKVLGICGSPRLHGNTEVLLSRALAKAQEGGAEIELVTVSGKTISPCDACNACAKTGKCHINDDMQDIYPKLLEADGIIFSSPVYFWSISSQAKALIDRCYAFRGGYVLRNKAAGTVITAERSGGTNTAEVFAKFMLIQKMIYVGWALGLTGSEGFSKKTVVEKDESGIARAEKLGESMAHYLKTGEIPA